MQGLSLVLVVLTVAILLAVRASGHAIEVTGGRISIGLLEEANLYLADDLPAVNLSYLISDHGDVLNITLDVVDLSGNFSVTAPDFLLLQKVCNAILKNGTSLLISDVPCDDVPSRASTLQSFPVVHLFIMTSRCRYDVTSKNAISYRPLHHWTEIVLEVIEKEHWRHLNIYYDDTTEKENVDYIIDNIYAQEISVTLVDVSDLTMDTLDVLDPLLNKIHRDILLENNQAGNNLVLCDRGKAGLVLKAFADREMRTMSQKWLAYHPKWRCENFVYLNLTLNDNMAVIRETDIRISEDAVKAELPYKLMTAIGKIFTYPFLDKVPKKTSKCTDQANEVFIDVLRRELEANMPYFGIYPNTTQFCIESHVGVGRRKEVAKWSAEKKLRFSDKLFPKTQWGFQGLKFVVSSLEYSFFQQKKNISGNITWVGLTFEILNELARVLNFTYEVTEPPDLMWGIQQADGQWNGMIREVLDGKVDFAAAGFSVTAGRRSVTDMASPYFSEQTVIMFRKKDSASRPLYIRPFSYTVWFCLMGCVVGSGLFLTILAIISPYEGVYPSRRSTQTIYQYYRFVLMTCLLYAYGCVVNQGGNRVAETQSMRCFAAFQWIMAVVMISTYTGNLIAFLAVQQVSLPFNTVSDMVKQDDLPWGTVQGTALNMLFRESNISDYKKVWAAMASDPEQLQVKTYDEARQKLKTDNWALIAEKSWYQQEHVTDCDLMMAKEEFFPTSYAWSLPKGSPYTQIFAESINKIREAGLLNFWIKNWTPKNLVCKGLTKVTTAKAAPLQEVQSAFIILGFLVCFALVILMLECMWKHRPCRNTSKPQGGDRKFSNAAPPNGKMFTLTASSGGSSTLKLTDLQDIPS